MFVNGVDVADTMLGSGLARSYDGGKNNRGADAYFIASLPSDQVLTATRKVAIGSGAVG